MTSNMIEIVGYVIFPAAFTFCAGILLSVVANKLYTCGISVIMGAAFSCGAGALHVILQILYSARPLSPGDMLFLFMVQMIISFGLFPLFFLGNRMPIWITLTKNHRMLDMCRVTFLKIPAERLAGILMHIAGIREDVDELMKVLIVLARQSLLNDDIFGATDVMVEERKILAKTRINNVEKYLENYPEAADHFLNETDSEGNGYCMVMEFNYSDSLKKSSLNYVLYMDRLIIKKLGLKMIISISV